MAEEGDVSGVGGGVERDMGSVGEPRGEVAEERLEA